MNNFRGIILLLILVPLTVSLNTFAGQGGSYFHQKYTPAKLSNVYKRLATEITDDDIKTILDEKRVCESNIILKLSGLDENIANAFALRAYDLELLDDVEISILMKNINAYFSIKVPRDVSDYYRVDSGKNAIKSFYKNVAFSNGCIQDTWDEFSGKFIVEKASLKDTLNDFTYSAYKERWISLRWYRILKFLNEKNDSDDLTIDGYLSKKKKLAQFDFEINNTVTDFHIKTQTKNNYGIRYNMYKDLSAYQMNEIGELLTRLVKRLEAKSGHIVLMDGDDEVQEKVELNSIEQFHFGLKLYSLEKKKLLAQSDFNESNLTFTNVLAVAFELGMIDESSLDGLYQLENNIKEDKESKWKKGIDFAEKYSFVVTSLTNPFVGIVMGLGISLVNQYFFPNQTSIKPEYDHDLFYGNCEMKL